MSYNMSKSITANPNSESSIENESNNNSSKRIGSYRIIILLLVVALVELAFSDFVLMVDQVDPTLSNNEGGGSNHRRGGHVLQTLLRFKNAQWINNNNREDATTSTNNVALPIGVTVDTSAPAKIHTLARMLEKVGIEVTQELIDKFPSMESITALYGDEVVIPGLLETCEMYRNAVALEDRHTGPAGMFNSGTNLLYTLLDENCILPNERMGVIWQVPWGKHRPLSSKHHNFPKFWLKVEHDDVLPLVVIKDPYTWMGSMCRKRYAAEWKQNPNHCPNLVMTDADVGLRAFKNMKVGDPIPVLLQYDKDTHTNHKHLVGLWNDYYLEYWNDKNPKLFVRYEDLLFRPEETTTKICECVGGTLIKHESGGFQFTTVSAKGDKGAHKGSSNLLSSLLRYSNSTERIVAFSTDDLKVAAAELDKEMLDRFHYPIPS